MTALGEPHDDVAVAVHDLGGDGPPLLLSHATGFHGRCYQPLAASLSDRYHSIAFDYRGHGDTPAPEGWEVSWPAYAADAEAVAAQLERPLVAFGHSMGGACLLMVARDHPDWFERLVLYEPVVIPSEFVNRDEPVGLAAGARRRRATFPSLQDAYDNYASKPPMAAFTPAALWAYVESGFRPTDDGVRLKCEPLHEAATFEQGPLSGVWSLLGDVTTPVTVVRGNTEMPGPAAFAESVVERLGDADLVALDHLDHFGPMTHPDEVAKLI